MLKEEFEERIGHPVSAEDYELIDRVYTWYPGIHDKDDIVKIYALQFRLQRRKILKQLPNLRAGRRGAGPPGAARL